MSSTRWLLAIGIFVVAALSWAAKRDTIPEIEQMGWRQGGSTRSQFQTLMFVEVDQAHLQDRATYDRAINWLCHTSSAPPNCRVAFYAPGDPFPPANTPPSGAILPPGYTRTLALYSAEKDGSRGSFDKWDCERAGSSNAPVGALCGTIGVNFDAVIKLSLRASRSVGCGWSLYDADAEGVRSFIQRISNVEERELYQRAYNTFYGTGSTRPDNSADCTRLRPQIEADASNARKVLNVPSQPLQPRPRGR